MTLFKSILILPFTLGLFFLLAVLAMKYYQWFKELTPKNKLRLLKSFYPRWILSSIAEIFRECLLHLRIYRQKKRLWYMHTSLAFGWFLLIVVGHAESVFATGHVFSSPWKSVFFDYFTRGHEVTGWQPQLFNHLMDLLLLFILSGLFLAVYKRINSRLLGLKRRPLHNSSDRIAMTFLWLIFPARFVAETLNHTFYGDGGFMTGFFGNLINLPGTMNFLSDTAWVIYSISLGGFFFVLPWSRYMHILTEVPHILLKNAHIQAYQDKGCTEFHLHACSSCGICLNSCQMTNITGYKGQSYYFIRKMRNISGVCDSAIMNCMMCGRCLSDCPVQVDTLSIRMNERIRRNDNLRFDYTYLDQSIQKVLPSRIAFFGGCMTQLVPGISTAMKKIFKLYGEDFVMIDETESVCCGRPLYLSGQKQAYFELIKHTRERILSCRPDLIITSCPICLTTFRNNYFFPVPVMHHTQYLELMIQKDLILSGQSNKKTVYHDPCELGRYLGIYSEPRQVLKKIVQLQNPDYRYNDGLCCGGSIADLEMDFEDKRSIAGNAIKQMIKPDTQLLATSCPLCKITFKTANIIPVKDIAEIFAELLSEKLPVEKLTVSEAMMEN